MRTYIVIMIILVAGGTLFDIVHKKSASYFFGNWRHVRNKGTRRVGGGEMLSLAIRTATVEGLASAEFCGIQRRIAHLVTMYGFLAYTRHDRDHGVRLSDADDAGDPAGAVDHRGADGLLRRLLVLVLHPGRCRGRGQFAVPHGPGRPVRRLASGERHPGPVWAYLQTAGGGTWTNIFLALYLAATTVLFGCVPWSKFSHMFYKPAAALQKRVEEANGSRRNLPAPADKPEVFGSARQQPRHY